MSGLLPPSQSYAPPALPGYPPMGMPFPYPYPPTTWEVHLWVPWAPGLLPSACRHPRRPVSPLLRALHLPLPFPHLLLPSSLISPGLPSSLPSAVLHVAALLRDTSTTRTGC